MNKSIIGNIIERLPIIGKWRKVFLAHSYPGHFYSPIPDLSYVKKNEDRIFERRFDELPGVDLNEESQLKLLECLKSVTSLFPYPSSESKYRFTLENNIYYTYYDAIVYFSFLIWFRPRRVIEVGSGYSSALLLDVNEFFLSSKINVEFIEPFPEVRLRRLIKASDQIQLRQDLIQDVPKEKFVSLAAGDILFIDTSHVSKTGSDVNHILFNILPLLKSGVIIHFHDIHFPFEYPQQWVYDRYSWNEAYLVRSFLMFNKKFRILFMNSLLAIKHPLSFEEAFCSRAGASRFDLNIAGSLWLEVC